MASGEHTLFLAGDTMLAHPWSGVHEARFLALIAEMRAADTTIVNLETVVHTFRGHPQADCGGIYMTSPPRIADELRWAGVDMASHANNHAFDYGSVGILETLEHCRAAGLVVAGTGENLHEAQAPRFVQSAGATVSLVSMTSTFAYYGAASLGRHDVPGRPGINPLRVTRLPEVTLTPRQRAALGGLARLLGRGSVRYEQAAFRVGPFRFRTGSKLALEAGRRIDRRDHARNLASIEAARRAAEFTVVAIHAHRQLACLQRFSREAIERGADVVLVHGPHEIRGIELHGGKPIFYGLGDFVFQPDLVSRFPAEAYEEIGLAPDGSAEDYVGDGMRSDLRRKRSVYEGVAAVVEYRDRAPSRIRLIPVDLQFDAPHGVRGRPLWAAPELGRRIVERMASISARYRCRVEYDAASNCGVAELTKPRRG